MKPSPESLTVYFSGGLFDHKQLVGNAWLAEAIYERSHGRYLPLLPQNFEFRGATAHSIRDHNLRALIGCDAALFHFDGTEIDGGTLVEFVFAKAADLPCVVVRSDARRGQEQRREAWNLMASFWPRTATVILDALGTYRSGQRTTGPKPPTTEVVRLAGQHSSARAQAVCEQIAAAVVRAFDRVTKAEPVMPRHLREEVFQWLALMPGLRGKEKALRREFERCLERKVERDLL